MKTILLMAITADGKIAKHSQQLTNWTSHADKKIFVEETKKSGVIIMGETTYQTIGKPLPGRLNVVMTFKPETDKNITNNLEYTDLPPAQLLQELSKRGFTSAIIGGGATINGLFLKENMIDEVWLTVEPRLFGEGMSLFQNVDVNLPLELLEIKQLDKNVVQLRYKIKK